jgi:hypothetical protein
MLPTAFSHDVHPVMRTDLRVIIEDCAIWPGWAVSLEKSRGNDIDGEVCTH